MTSTTNEPDHPDLLTRFDPAIIHQILLAGKEAFSSLSKPESRLTLTFEEFQDSLDDSQLEHLEQDLVPKKALRDRAIERLRQFPNDLTPLKELLFGLHQEIRSLVPSRADLHSILRDEPVTNSNTLEALKPWIRKAASALQQLESESRASTTTELITRLQNTPTTQEDDDNSHEFWCDVLFYLLYKAELCQADKEDFYFTHIWGPRILQEGPTIERQLYQEKFGSFSDPQTSPNTRKWIETVLQSQYIKRPSRGNPQCHESDSESEDSQNNVSRLTESKQSRKEFLRKAWLEDIVFRDSDKSSLKLPEIFSMDNTGLKRIRDITRMAVAGCALVLHARTEAGFNTPEVSDEPKTRLLQAMNSRHVPPHQYEDGVVQQVIALATNWNPTVDQASLRGRVIAVLRGQDPVLKVLNNRVKVAVRDVVLQKLHDGNSAEAPTQLRTGRMNCDQQSAEKPETSSAAEKLFCQRGLAAFAVELALVAKLAGKIADLAIDLYWDEFLDKLVSEQCQEAEAFSVD